MSSQMSTPVRTQTSIPRRTNNFYGPGVLLQDVDGAEIARNLSGSEDDNFDFGEPRRAVRHFQGGVSMLHD